jgi:predicted MFS family arabinose efflux permease
MTNHQVRVSDSHKGARFAQLAILALTTFAAASGRYGLSPVQETMQRTLRFTDGQIALIQGPSMALPMVLFSVPIGLIVDRYSRKYLYALLLGLGISGTILCAVATTVSVFFVARFLVGLALCGVLIASNSIVCDLYRPEQRGRALMVLVLAEVLAGPVAFAAGGWLLASVDLPILAAWRAVILVLTLPLLAAFTLIPFLTEPSRHQSSSIRLPVQEVVTGLWHVRTMIGPLLLARIMVWIADGALVVWGAPLFARSYGLGPGTIGEMMASALLVSGLLGPFLGGPAADALQKWGGPRRCLDALAVLGFLCVALATFSVMPSATLSLVLLTSFLTIGYVITVISTAVGTIVIEPFLRPAYIALSLTAGAFFSIGVAPLVVNGASLLLGGSQYISGGLLIVCCTTSFVGSVIFLFSRTAFPRRDSVEPTNELARAAL